MGFEFDREQQAELRYIGADSDIDRISCKGYDVNVLSGQKREQSKSDPRFIRHFQN